MIRIVCNGCKKPVPDGQGYYNLTISASNIHQDDQRRSRGQFCTPCGQAFMRQWEMPLPTQIIREEKK